jgi:outer membrane protein assembly factor BamB
VPARSGWRGLPVFALLCLLVVGPAKADPWPQWRGLAGTGVSRETNLVLTWSPTNNIRWRCPLVGAGLSSPVVWGDHLYLTTETDGEIVPGAKAPIHHYEGEEFRHPESLGADRQHALRIVCIRVADGQVAWEQTVHDGRVYDDRHRLGSYAAPTPATDGRRVVAYFGAEGLFCHDRDGRRLWQADMGTFSTLGLGPGSSPILAGDRVVIQGDQRDGEGSFIAAWDLETGRQIWRTERRVSASWSSPILVQRGDRAVILASGSERLAAYDPATGRELWSAAGLTNNAVPSPIVSGSVALFAAGYPKKRAMALDFASGRPVWESARGTAYVPSPVPWEDRFYLMTDAGLITCLDAATGRPQYEGERLPAPARFTASPVAVAGRILLTAEDGRTFVVRAGPKLEVERVNSLGEPVRASPAIADGRIYLRGASAVFAIGL